MLGYGELMLIKGLTGRKKSVIREMVDMKVKLSVPMFVDLQEFILETTEHLNKAPEPPDGYYLEIRLLDEDGGVRVDGGATSLRQLTGRSKQWSKRMLRSERR